MLKRTEKWHRLRKVSGMNPPSLHEATIEQLNRKPPKVLEKIINEDKARLRALPDPFCRWCKKRKPCDCR